MRRGHRQAEPGERRAGEIDDALAVRCAHLNPNGTLVCTAFGVSPDPAAMPNPDGSPHHYYEVDPVTGASTKVVS